jgi:hypothetical protein
MSFHFPEAFYLIIPWVLFCIIVGLNQGSALAWLKTNVSDRFRGHFTRYSSWRLIIHVVILFISGLALIWALAMPYKSGKVGHIKKSRNIFIIIDSSYSMYAQDMLALTKNELRSKTRFEAAKSIALEFIDTLKDDKIGLITFSGKSSVHSTPTLDHAALTSMINNLDVHLLKQTGSDFSKPLQDLIHIAQFKSDNYAALLISDGEPLPEEQDYLEEILALKAAHVAIFTIGLGTDEGSSLNLYSPQDVYNRVQNPRTIKTVQTKRVSRTLKEIASETGAHYFELEDGVGVSDVIKALDKIENREIEEASMGKADNSHPALLVFLVLFFVEMFYLFPKITRFFSFILPLFLLCSCESDLLKAHEENEIGIDKYDVALFDVGRPHFETSVLYRVKDELPLLNLGNTYLQKKDFITAHDYFQRSAQSNPELGEAYFNDGVALFLWAEDEVDPRGCFLAKSEELYDQAIDRFELAKKKGLEVEKNTQYIIKRIQDLYKLQANAKNCPDGQKSSHQSKHAPQQQDQQQQQQNQNQNQQQDQQQQQQNQNQNQQQNQQQQQQNQNQNQQQNQQQQQQNQNQNQQQNQQQQQQNQNQHQQQNQQQQQQNQNQNQQQNQQQQSQNQKPQMTEHEKEQVESELQRIRLQSGQDQGFNQSGDQQYPGDGTYDDDVLW